MASLEMHKNISDSASAYIVRHSPAQPQPVREPDQYRQEAARFEKQFNTLVAKVAEL